MGTSHQVSEQAEGEARRYFEHAITLRNTLKFIRHNPSLFGEEAGASGIGIDLLRLESMASLDAATLKRVLQKNYRFELYKQGEREKEKEGERGR